MNSSPTSGSDRQLARNKGLARISALAVGAGAAGLVGAVAIAVTLPGSTLGNGASSASASGQSAGTSSSSDDDSTSGHSDDDGSTSQLPSQPQSATAPSVTNSPPVATSGAS